jgi:shikimate dehydrogenase
MSHHTTRYVIVGYPVSHSRSPTMHNAAFRALGIDAIYEPYEVRPEALPAAISGMRDPGAATTLIAGANVTLPHKTAVIALLDHVADDALAIGAVNTLFRDGARLCGENTDAPGLARALLEAGVELQGRSAIVLGAGGAARASIVGLARWGVTSIAIAARRKAEAARLATELQAAVGSCALQALDMDRAMLAAAFAQTDLLVQATSATLDDGPHAEAFARALPMGALPAHAVVTDLVYKPLETRVLAEARAHGLRTVDGLGMLLHQGALAFERWTGRAAPLEVMRNALLT